MKVFLTVGTHEQPFARMVELADRLATGGHEAVIQYGYSAAPMHALGFAFAPAHEVTEHVRSADAVVTHGGPATVLQVLAERMSPVVLPRSARLGEHVDDHQLGFASHMARKGLVRLAHSLEDAERLLLEPAPDVDVLLERRATVEANRLKLAESLDAWMLSQSTGRR